MQWKSIDLHVMSDLPLFSYLVTLIQVTEDLQCTSRIYI